VPGDEAGQEVGVDAPAQIVAAGIDGNARVSSLNPAVL
jgi:hypothetical protein